MTRNDGLDSKIDKLITTPKSYDEFASIMPKGDAMLAVPNNGASMEHTQQLGHILPAKAPPPTDQDHQMIKEEERVEDPKDCLLYTSPSPRDQRGSRMPSSA